MNGKTTFALVVFAALACGREAPPREGGPESANGSEDPAARYAGLGYEAPKASAADPHSSATSAFLAFPLKQDTARTVTRRIWADASLGSVSPDGRYASITDWDTGDLAIRDLETGEVRYLTHNPDPWEPGFADGHLISRDGTLVAFSWYEFGEDAGYRLGIVATGGGTPRFIPGSPAQWINPLDWSQDGAFILASREVGPKRELLMVSAKDGGVQALRTFQDPAPSGFPQHSRFSPDGRFVAYDYHKPGEEADYDLYVLDVETGQEHVLVQSPAFDGLLGWAPDGKHILFQSDRGGTPGAWLLPVAEGRATGSPWLVKPDLWRVQGLGFAEDGRYFYTVETGKRDVFVASFDPETRMVVGSATPVTPRSFGDGVKPLWSPDGRHLAYTVETGPIPMQSWAWSPQSIVIHSFDTGAIKELSLDVSGVPRAAGWTPDGRGLFVVTSNLNDPELRNALYRVDIQTGEEEILLRLGHDHDLAGLRPSSDGRSVFVAGAEVVDWANPAGLAEGESRLATYTIVKRNLETGDITELFKTPPGGPGQIRGISLSLDGQSLAFGYCPPGGPDRLVVLPTDGEGLREIVEGTFGATAWMPNGEALLAYGWLEEGAPSRAFYVDLAGGEPQPIGISGDIPGFSMDVHPDGNRITYTYGTTGSELWVMENFLPETRKGERAGPVR